jgi:hypothetical protein
MHWITDPAVAGLRLMHRGQSVCRIVPANCGFHQVLFDDGRDSDPMSLEDCKRSATLWASQVYLKDKPAPAVTPLMAKSLEENTRVRERVSHPSEHPLYFEQPGSRRR